MTKIQVVYQVKYPDRVAAILEQISDLVTLNFDELWKPLQCIQLRGFHDQLLVLVLGPIVLVLLTPILTFILNLCRPRLQTDSSARLALLEALPFALTILFLAYPTVSSHAFLAFNCEPFDGKPTGPWHERTVGAQHHYLIADYGIRCWTESDSGEVTFSSEYRRIRSFAIAAIFAYPIGVPTVFAVLLF